MKITFSTLFTILAVIIANAMQVAETPESLSYAYSRVTGIAAGDTAKVQTWDFSDAGAALRVHQLIPNNYIFKFLKLQVLTIVKMGGGNYRIKLFCNFAMTNLFNCITVKNHIIMKRLLSLAAVCFLACSPLLAYDFIEGGLCYNINPDGETVTVTYQNESSPRYSSLVGEVEIPPSVTSSGKTYSVSKIGSEAFSYCADITSMTIPNTITSIGGGAFHCCSSLSEVIINAPIEEISDYAFYECVNLRSVNIPNTVTKICECAFYDCGALSEIVLPNSLTSIELCSFHGCAGLSEITIPYSVSHIGFAAFYNCTGLTSVVWNAKKVKNLSASTPNTVFNESTSIRTFSFGEGVEMIPPYLCYNFSNLEAINIPASVTSIGNKSFFGCYNLSSIVVDPANQKYDSRDNCNAVVQTETNTLVLGCQNTVIPSSVTTIGGSAFWGCSGLTSLTIPNSVTAIGESAFYNCSGLTSLYIPNSVNSIGGYAMMYCSKLTSVNIPNSLNIISNYTFMGCEGITSVEIPNSVVSIGEVAFGYCTNLASVEIPQSVSEIKNGAFINCTALSSVTNNASTPQSIDETVFAGVNITNCKLNVWHESIDKYKAAPVWKDFLIEDLGGVDGIEADETAKDVEGYYNLQGVRFDNPERGQVSIVRYTDGTAKKIVIR